MKSVSTASTKSQNRKQKQSAAQSNSSGNSKTVSAAAAPANATLHEISDRTWLIASVSILAVATFLRLYDLNLVPFHHDEGVNGNFLVSLVRNGRYQYDPANYHGPTLYYFSAIIPWIFRLLFGAAAQNAYGLTTFTIRLIPSLFGVATIWLVLLLRRRLGSVGALAAAGLLAISPGAVYLSRYFIHETLFVFFTLGLVVAALKYYEEAHPIYLLLASASAALLFATKETAIISVGVLGIALVCTHAYRWLTGKAKSSNIQPGSGGFVEFLERVGGPIWLAVWTLVAIAVFVGINILFYSSFFTNYPKGVYDAIKTFEFWTKTGREAHVHPPTKYLYWLMSQESFLLFFGAIGAFLVVLKPKKTFPLFAALWAFGLIAAYSLISYKTPWLALNFIVPLSLIAGYVFQFLYETKWASVRELAVLALIACGIGGYQTFDLNFFNYDNDDTYYVYVYAHTRRETLKMLDEVERIAKVNQGGQTGITIVSPEYWPLPWYLRDYGRVGYFGRISDSTEPIIIAAETQKSEVEEKFGSRYRQLPSGLNAEGSFSLRPGVNLLVYVRRDVSPGSLNH